MINIVRKVLKELHNKSIIKKVLNENYQDENISQEERNRIIGEYGWLKDEEKIEGILKNPPFEKQFREKNRYYNRIVNSYRVRYIISNEVKKNVYFNYVGWANFVMKVGQVIGLPITVSKATVNLFFNDRDEVTKYGLEGKHLEDKKNIGQELRKSLKKIDPEEYNKRIEDIINYLKNTDITEYPNSLSKLLRDFDLITFNEKTIKSLIDFFKYNPKISFYLSFINEKNYWNKLVKFQEMLAEVIDNPNISKRYDERRMMIKKYDKIIEGKELYLFNEDGNFTEEEKDILKNWFNLANYEHSFTELGFYKPQEKGAESLIHNLHRKGIGYNVSNEIKDNTDTGDVVKFVINNIINYLKNTKDIIKYDIVSKDTIKDINGNEVIPKGSKIEVKDINNSDSYFAEFLSSPVKSDSEILYSEVYRGRYNKIIEGVYDWLSRDSVGMGIKNTIKWLMTNDLEGMIISNNIYVPNKDGNIEFYLSNIGQSNPENHIRITIRYNINLDKSENFYRIGDGKWRLNGKPSKKGILYPLPETESNLIRPKDKQIYKTIEESKTKSTIKKILKEELDDLDWIQDTVTAKLAKNEDWILVNDIDRESITEGHEIQKYLFDLGYSWVTGSLKNSLKDFCIYTMYHYGNVRDDDHIYYSDGCRGAEVRISDKDIKGGRHMIYYWSDLKPKTIKEENDLEWLTKPRNNPLDGLRLTTPMGRGGSYRLSSFKSGLTIKDDGGTHVTVTSSNGSSEYDRGTVENFIKMGIWLPIDSMNESEGFDWFDEIKPTLNVAFEEGLIKKGSVLTLSGELTDEEGRYPIQVSDFKIKIEELRGPDKYFKDITHSYFIPLQEKYFEHLGYDKSDPGDSIRFANSDGHFEILDIS